MYVCGIIIYDQQQRIVNTNVDWRNKRFLFQQIEWHKLHLGRPYLAVIPSQVLYHRRGNDLISEIELVDVSGGYICLHPAAGPLTSNEVAILLDLWVKMASLVTARVSVVKYLRISSVFLQHC